MSVSEETRFWSADRPATTEIDPFLARRILAGWSADAIATAGGVSRRTAYRWIAEVIDVVDLEIAGWRATYAIRRSKGPLRLTEWRR